MNFSDIKSILLVDDDIVSNLFNKLFIAGLNLDIEVDEALNGQEALNLLIERENPNRASLLAPCLLILDINMPVMNGWEFLEQYDKLIPESVKDEIVIVMLTISEEQDDMIKAMNNPNIREFVKKPLSEKAFKKLIKKYFNREQVL